MKYQNGHHRRSQADVLKTTKILELTARTFGMCLLEYVYRALPKVIEQRCIKTNFVHNANVEALVPM